MPCEHSYGIIRNLDSEKDYAKLEGFDTFAAAIQAYNCAAINDDALND